MWVLFISIAQGLEHKRFLIKKKNFFKKSKKGVGQQKGKKISGGFYVCVEVIVLFSEKG